MLAPQVPDWLAGREADNVTTAAHQLIEQGVPDQLAQRVSAGLASFGLLDVIEVAELTGHLHEWVAQLYYTLSAHLDIEWMLSLVSGLERRDRWHALARLTLRDDLYSALRKITQDALRTGGTGIDPMTAVAQWNRRTRTAIPGQGDPHRDFRRRES